MKHLTGILLLAVTLTPAASAEINNSFVDYLQSDAFKTATAAMMFVTWCKQTDTVEYWQTWELAKQVVTEQNFLMMGRTGYEEEAVWQDIFRYSNAVWNSMPDDRQEKFCAEFQERN